MDVNGIGRDTGAVVSSMIKGAWKGVQILQSVLQIDVIDSEWSGSPQT
jgi:hypothetical protein